MSSSEKRENEFSAKLHDAQSTPFLRVLGESGDDHRKSARGVITKIENNW